MKIWGRKIWDIKSATAVLALLLLATLQLAHAQTETLLHNFCPPPGPPCPTDGQYPKGGLVRDSAGNLYGTTEFGGEGNLGAVYKITPDGRFGVWYSFQGFPDGAQPMGGLTIDSAGNLYGTTSSGGNSTSCEFGCGTVYKITPTAEESVLYNFGSQVGDGTEPWVAPALDSAGNLYGVTNEGGTQGGGIVWELTPTGVETILYNFSANLVSPDPAVPFTSGSFALDNEGNLYGTSSYGGGKFGGGTVFKITPAGAETTLYSFCSKRKKVPPFLYCTDGQGPQASVILDSSGNLYGTTFVGGNTVGLQGQGLVFRLTPTGKESIVHEFGNVSGDGTNPVAGVILDNEGDLYGATDTGGADNDGTVFKVANKGEETVLYSFGSQTPDGDRPLAAPIADNAGNLYGTTAIGGAYGNGAVWELAGAIPQSTTTTLTSSPNPSTVGESVTFTATVTTASGTPGGTVTFTLGKTVLDTVALSDGVAQYSTSALTKGKHTIKATYSGSSSYLTSSATDVQTVSKD